MKINKEKLDAVGKIIGNGCKLVLSGAAIALSYMSLNDIVKMIRYSGPIGYGDAVDAIMSSSMWSEDKKKAVASLKQDGDSEFYKAVIEVMNSSMWSEDKIKTIQSMCEK